MLGIRRRTLGWIAVAAGLVTIFAAACGGSSATVGTSDGGADGAAKDGAGADGASDDGGTVTDGGANLDPDAGDDSGENIDGALPDGGSCNAIANAATSVNSGCISAIPILGGGDLVAGTYYVTSVNVLGAATFCNATFKPSAIKETLNLAVAAGVGTANIVAEVDATVVRRSTLTVTPTTGNKSPATIDETCPEPGSEKAEYETSNTAGATTMRMRLPYGTGEAIYTFAKQ